MAHSPMASPSYPNGAGNGYNKHLSSPFPPLKCLLQGRYGVKRPLEPKRYRLRRTRRLDFLRFDTPTNPIMPTMAAGSLREVWVT